MDRERLSPCLNSVLMQDFKWKKRTKHHPELLDHCTGKHVLHDGLVNIECSYASATVLNTMKNRQCISLSEFDYSNFSILTELSSAN